MKVFITLASRLDAFVAGKSLATSADDVEDQDEDDEESQCDADGDGDDVVGHVVTVHWSLKERYFLIRNFGDTKTYKLKRMSP